MVVASHTLGSARGVRAREWLAVDDLESTALDLPLAWPRICRLQDRDACRRDRALLATTGGGSDTCLCREWRVVEARLVAVSASLPDGDAGVLASELSLESSDVALARPDVPCWRLSSC